MKDLEDNYPSSVLTRFIIKIKGDKSGDFIHGPDLAKLVEVAGYQRNPLRSVIVDT